MHHRNHSNSSANHGNPQHLKPKIPTEPSPGGRYAPPKKASVLTRIRDKFKEKPATKEEVEQLGLNAKREVYKTTIQKAKSARPSRLDSFLGGGGRSRSGGGSRRSSRSSDNSNSWVFGGGNSGGDFFGSSEQGPSLDMFKWGSEKKGGRRKKESSFGQGLTDLF